MKKLLQTDATCLKSTDWLPTSVKEMKALGWEYIDVVIFSGDAYVDHPSFGPAIISSSPIPAVWIHRLSSLG